MTRLSSLVLVGLLVAGRAEAKVDFLEQELSVDLVKDPTQVTVKATVKVAVTSATTSLILLPTSLPLVSLAWNGTPLTVKKGSSSLVAELPAPAAAGEQGTLSAVLAGTPSCSYGSYVTCLRSASLTYLMPASASGAWYLVNLDSASYDTFKASLDLLLPAAQRALSIGVPAKVTAQPDGSALWRFVANEPTLDLLFVAGALVEVSSSGGFPALGLCPDVAATRKGLQAALDEGSKLVPYFSKLWGAPPISELHYGVVKGSTPWAGTSYQGLILLNEIIFAPAYEYIVAQVNHELGHLWWGTMAYAPSAVESGFFSESLAEYSLWRGRGELAGEAVRATGSRMNAVWYMYRRPAGDLPVLSQLGSESAVFAIYHKGSTVVRTLEEAAGVDALDAGLRAVIKAGWSASLADFVAAVKAAGGVDLTPYVQKWLGTVGYPTLKVSSTIKGATGGVVVLTLAASGEDFPLKLPVRLRYADGKSEARALEVKGGSGALSLELAARPALVELDPGWTAVRELRPALEADVSLDGQVDGADLLEVALRVGTSLPTVRRVDGKYDPLYDLDGDRQVGEPDLERVVARASAK